MLLTCALVVAVAAAVRSTWSPCGWSMLSTITPLTESSKGHRFGATAAWFVGGATVGGVLLGIAGAVVGVGVDVLGLAPHLRALLGGLLLLAAAAADGRLIGPPLPHHRRQVNEIWLDEYRPWVYAGGFGLQIGAGLATYIMTAAVYAVVGLAALTVSPVDALVVGATFGFARGLAVLAGRRNSTPAALTAFHRRFDAWTEPVRRALILVETTVGGALIGHAIAGGLLAAALGLIAAVASVAALRRDRERSTRRDPHPRQRVVDQRREGRPARRRPDDRVAAERPPRLDEEPLGARRAPVGPLQTPRRELAAAQPRQSASREER